MTLKDEKPAYPVVATGTEMYIQRSDIFSFFYGMSLQELTEY